MQENSIGILESKKKENVYQNYKAELEKILSASENLLGKLKSLVTGSQTSKQLNKQTAELGLLFLNELPEYKDKQAWGSNRLVQNGGKRYQRIKELLSADEWNDAGNYNLLLYFFGETKAPLVKYAWEHIRFQMYQTGYTRRSFRAPNNREMYFVNQLNLIVNLIPQSHSVTHTYTPEYKEKYSFYELSVIEQIRYCHAVGDVNQSLFMLWSAAMDMGNTEVFSVAENIIFNKDDTGKVTRSLIKALLNSEKQECWQLVEKLLLAAQRQEGLRQTVLEALDETSIGALRYMIKVIIENNLARFSSVVRSIDVWAGLGWESERETTVKYFLEKAAHYLNNTNEIPGAVKSDNNADVYMALWAQGVYDIDKTVPLLQQLYKEGNAEKRTLALLFAGITHHPALRMPLLYTALADEDLQPLACVAWAIHNEVSAGQNNKFYNEHYPGLFNELHTLYKRVTVKERTFESYIFSWLKIKFEKKNIMLSMLRLTDNEEKLTTVLQYFDVMDAVAKRQLTDIILPGYSRYNFTNEKEKTGPLTEMQRGYALLILKDRSEYSIAFKALKNTAFTAAEATVFPDLLKRKAAEFRNGILEILLKQSDDIITTVVNAVLQGDTDQRLAALDIMLQLQKSRRLNENIQTWLSTFKQRKTISQSEEILLSQLEQSGGTKDISAANGYGLFNPLNMAAIVQPQIKAGNIYEKWYAAHEFAFSMPYSDIKKALMSLIDTLKQYKDYEYEVENYDGSKEKVLLGNQFRTKSYKKAYVENKDSYEDYPLPDVWREWYTANGLHPRDLFIISISTSHNDKLTQLPVYSDVVGDLLKTMPSFYHSVFRIVQALRLAYPFDEVNEFALGAAARQFALLDKKVLLEKIKDNYYPRRGEGWQSSEHLNVFLKSVNLFTLDDGLIKDCWNLYNWRQFSGLPEAAAYSFPPLILFCRAFKSGVISEDEMYRGIMCSEHLTQLSSKKSLSKEYDYFEKFPFLKSIYQKVIDHILDIELKRGDSDTSLTLLASGIKNIYGVKRFSEILAGLGKTALYRGYSYYFNSSGKNKQELFSSLLKHSHPLPDDTQAFFNESMQRIKAGEVKLIEAAVYAPQWQKFISNYLGWKGLDSAIWWMHAHTKTDFYSSQNTELESEIARYSSVDLQDFKDGAVDKEWFLKAYKEIGKQRWPIVYDAAKYISDGNGHRRARIYADVLLGELSIKDVTEKITSKRDQDYVRIYGLVPLAKRNQAKDVLARYEFLQQFKKESRQFGAQKQTSEALALRVAMENLARNAGYPDPERLTWSMETKQVQNILSKQTQVQYDDVLIGLIINEDGMAEVVAYKDDKQLKDIPSKYKKDSQVIELLNFRKTLREQFKRSRRGLEDAMVRSDEFSPEELTNLFNHPVISRHLEKLVFVTEDEKGNFSCGFYKNETLISPAGETVVLKDSSRVRIAHCADLLKSQQWSTYQHYLFDKKIQQPFKQIFRELYLPTQDELQEKNISRRYAGHQVQPKQTAALLRSRGWKADYEEGLQKVYHKQGFAAKIYAMADWYSPAEVEPPTLETVVFQDLKTFTNIDFDKINERIFSEVMRDLDLVVSVAHAGAVDAEASHSSIEMRAVLLKETMRLFKVTNVEVAGSHAKIKGTLGEYSVHLGSAVAHRVAGGYLSVLPVHSQHRGRLFLPFIDDDPKSAEVISKVLLLARDKDIQDPTILTQITG